jgi:hypothetical protein
MIYTWGNFIRYCHSSWAFHRSTPIIIVRTVRLKWPPHLVTFSIQR